LPTFSPSTLLLVSFETSLSFQTHQDRLKFDTLSVGRCYITYVSTNYGPLQKPAINALCNLSSALSTIMDKLRCYTIFILCCMFTIFPFTDGVGDGAGQPNLEGHKRILSFPDMLRNMFSFPKTSPITTTSTRYWEKVKTLINQVHTYFFYPNIE
jgi:hypothetical protein